MELILNSMKKNIERVFQFCYLGVTLDENLSWQQHVEIVCSKVSKRINFLVRIRPYITLRAAKCVYNCIIHPILTDTVWGNYQLAVVRTCVLNGPPA